MLLRRVSEHVKAQNWTAVALDFVIVVVGVFIGLQLGNWNEARRAQSDGSRALSSLLSESEQIIVAITAEVDRIDAEIERRRSIVEAISYGHADQLYADDIAWAMGSARDYRSVIFSTSIYDALVGNGTLNAISDRESIKSVKAFYAGRDRFTNTLDYFQYFIIEEYPHLAKYDGVTAVFDADAVDDRTFEVDVTSALQSEDFREDAVSLHRNQVSFQGVRTELLNGALDMCRALAKDVGRPCSALAGTDGLEN